jgi:hypothetical protein
MKKPSMRGNLASIQVDNALPSRPRYEQFEFGERDEPEVFAFDDKVLYFYRAVISPERTTDNGDGTYTHTLRAKREIDE